MKTLTLRGLRPDIAEEVRRQAARSGKSMNRCILDLIEANVVGDTTGKPREYSDLDLLFGSLTEEDAKYIEEAAADSRTIDEEQWR